MARLAAMNCVGRLENGGAWQASSIPVPEERPRMMTKSRSGGLDLGPVDLGSESWRKTAQPRSVNPESQALVGTLEHRAAARRARLNKAFSHMGIKSLIK